MLVRRKNIPNISHRQPHATAAQRLVFAGHGCKSTLGFCTFNRRNGEEACRTPIWLCKAASSPAGVGLVAMLKAAGLTSFETEKPIPLTGGITTRPDVYFHAPNDQFQGVCIYLDGMSEHLHGNAQTAVKGRQIRDELRNTDYEVVAIQYQELYDKTVMRTLMPV